MVLPLQRELARIAALVGKRILQRFERSRRLVHGHLDATRILRRIAGEAPLAGLRSVKNHEAQEVTVKDGERPF